MSQSSVANRAKLVSHGPDGQPVEDAIPERLDLGSGASIENRQGIWLFTSNGDESVTVNGETVAQKVLDHNDLIVIDGKSMTFVNSASTEVRPKLIRAVGPRTLYRVVLIFLVVFALWIGLRALRSPSQVSAAPSPTPIAEATPTPIPDFDAALANARMNYAVGERLYRERSALPENLYLSIKEWKRVVEALAPTHPELPVVQTAKEKLVKAESELAQLIDLLKKRAFAANQTKNYATVRQLLTAIQATDPNPLSENYAWAAQKLISLPAPTPTPNPSPTPDDESP